MVNVLQHLRNQRTAQLKYGSPSAVTSTQTGTATGLGITNTTSQISKVTGTAGISPSITPPSGPITWQGGSQVSETPSLAGGPTPMSGGIHEISSGSVGGVTGSWSTLMPGDNIIQKGWWNNVDSSTGGVDDSVSEQLDETGKLIDKLEGWMVGDQQNDTYTPLSEQVQDVINTYGQLRGSGLQDVVMGYDSEGRPFIQSATVGESKETQVYEMLGYDSHVQYAYSALTGHVREPTGRKATIFDYAIGAGAMELTPESYVHDYRNYYQAGYYQDYGYDYQIPYRYRRMIQWLS